LLKAIHQWFKPEGPGLKQWKSWLGHALIALSIALALKLVVGAPGGYAMAIPVSMYSGREVFSAADEWLEGNEDIDWVDHWFDLFTPLVVVGTVFGLAGWL
jgi:hypothetical protein